MKIEINIPNWLAIVITIYFIVAIVFSSLLLVQKKKIYKYSKALYQLKLMELNSKNGNES